MEVKINKEIRNYTESMFFWTVPQTVHFFGPCLRRGGGFVFPFSSTVWYGNSQLGLYLRCIPLSALIEGGWIAVVIILIVLLLGCAVSLFGGGSGSNAYTPVSAEVEAYEPLIQKYAKQYGNSGDACRQKQYTVGSSSIYGYGCPAY